MVKALGRMPRDARKVEKKKCLRTTWVIWTYVGGVGKHVCMKYGESRNYLEENLGALN
jgi:hypothetical protein